MNRLKIVGDIRKVANAKVSEEDLFQLIPTEFGIGGGAVATGRMHALQCMCDATFLFEHAYICKLNQIDQVKIHARKLQKSERAFYSPLFACYGFDAPAAVRNFGIKTTQAAFIEDTLWKEYSDAVALSFTAAAKVRRSTFAGSAINGSVARYRPPEAKVNEFNTDPLMHIPGFSEGYMWFTGVSVDLAKIKGKPHIEHIDRAFYYLKGLEPTGSFRHHCHGLITAAMPGEWTDESTLDWSDMERTARAFLEPRTALDDFPVHLSDACEMEIIKAAIWEHGEGDITYSPVPE